MDLHNNILKVICIILTSFIACYFPSTASGEEYNSIITDLQKNYPFTPPSSGEITEDQLVRFFAVVKVMHELIKYPAASWRGILLFY